MAAVGADRHVGVCKTCRRKATHHVVGAQRLAEKCFGCASHEAQADLSASTLDLDRDRPPLFLGSNRRSFGPQIDETFLADMAPSLQEPFFSTSSMYASVRPNSPFT